MATAKQKAWQACSKYIRLRDSIEYCRVNNLPLDSSWAQCCTCGAVKQWKYMDAGHFISRGLGGGSGVYFDERNINIQCKRCNAWDPEMLIRYLSFMEGKYGRDVIDQLHVLDKVGHQGEPVAVEAMYQEMFEELCKMTKGITQ